MRDWRLEERGAGLDMSACLNEIISNYFSLQSTVKKLFDEDRKQKGGVAEGEMTEFKCLKMLSGLSCI